MSIINDLFSIYVVGSHQPFQKNSQEVVARTEE